MIARRGVAHGSGVGKVRWVVEQAFAWLHQFKRLRICYERRADIHQGLLALACSLITMSREPCSHPDDAIIGMGGPEKGQEVIGGQMPQTPGAAAELCSVVAMKSSPAARA